MTEREADRERVLVVYGRAAWTRPVAEALAESLACDGIGVKLADADAETRDAPSPEDYDAVVIGSTQRLGRSAQAITEYVAHHRDALSAMPTFWLAIGHTRASHPDRMRRATGWLPAHSFAIVRPSRRVRWFGDPNAERAPYVRELAQAIVDAVAAAIPRR